jgi:hypothetical protein
VASGEFRPVDLDAVVYIVMSPILMRMIWRHSLDVCAAASVPDQAYFNEYFELMLRGLCAGERAITP